MNTKRKGGRRLTERWVMKSIWRVEFLVPWTSNTRTELDLMSARIWRMVISMAFFRTRIVGTREGVNDFSIRRRSLGCPSSHRLVQTTKKTGPTNDSRLGRVCYTEWTYLSRSESCSRLRQTSHLHSRSTSSRNLQLDKIRIFTSQSTYNATRSRHQT